MSRARILSLDVTLGKYEAVLDQIIELAQKGTPSYVCFANVHMTVEAATNESVRKATAGADIITADGMPLAKAIGYKYGLEQDRIAGMDAMPDLLAKAASASLSVFFLGTTDKMLQTIGKKARDEHPSLEIAGMIAPPFGEDLDALSEEYVTVINNSGVNIVMVALGCPKQELWMAKYSGKINAVLLGLGGAFPVYAETIERAPVWMQKYALEWLYRLASEPLRLFGRYFRTNSYFLICMFFEVLSYKLSGKKR